MTRTVPRLLPLTLRSDIPPGGRRLCAGKTAPHLLCRGGALSYALLPKVPYAGASQNARCPSGGQWASPGHVALNPWPWRDDLGRLQRLVLEVEGDSVRRGVLSSFHASHAFSASPQLVRRTSVISHRLSTVETNRLAGHRLRPPIPNGCHLCGRSSRCTSTSDAGSRLSCSDLATCRLTARDHRPTCSGTDQRSIPRRRTGRRAAEAFAWRWFGCGCLGRADVVSFSPAVHLTGVGSWLRRAAVACMERGSDDTAYPRWWHGARPRC